MDSIAKYLKQINELENQMVEITAEEQNKVKRILKTGQSQRPLGPYQTHQHSNYRGPKRRREKIEYQKIFEEIIVENFPNMEKEIVSQASEAQRVPYRINPRRNMPRYILVKLVKAKHKERILKAPREKQQVTYKGSPIDLTTDLSA